MGSALLVLNVVAFVLCVVFLCYFAAIVVAYLRRPAAELGDIDRFGWHLLVPCLDEALVIEASVERLLYRFPAAHIWCVDDASVDGTGDIVARLARNEPRLHLVRRALPEAQKGKGEALNHAWREIVAWESANRSTDPSTVIVGVIDADGDLDPRCLEVLAGADYFGDEQIGAIQVAVRIANRTTGSRPAPSRTRERVLVDLQDVEFVGPIGAMQILRMRTGSVAMGGNGQFTRLSVLNEIAEQAGTPWHGALLEDFELGLHVLLAGHKTAYCHDTAVAQEGLPTLRSLIRQRSRWAQGSMQCFRYVPRILASEEIGNAAAFEILYFMLMPWIQLFGSLVYAATYVVMFWFLVIGWTGASGWLHGGQWAVIPMIVLGGMGPFVVWGPLYRRKIEPSLRWADAWRLGFANWAYSNLNFVIVWWATARLLLARADWKKTRRVAPIPAVLAPGPR